MENQLIKLTEDIAELKAMLRQLLAQPVTKEKYTTAEVSELLGKAEYTVREWCRQGRIQAIKKPCGRGKAGEWLITHDELTRLRNDGLLPLLGRT